MDKTQFFDVLSVWEAEMKRQGLTLDQIEDIEIDAFRLSQNEFNQGHEEYLRTLVRLSNSGFWQGTSRSFTGRFKPPGLP